MLFDVILYLVQQKKRTQDLRSLQDEGGEGSKGSVTGIASPKLSSQPMAALWPKPTSGKGNPQPDPGGASGPVGTHPCTTTEQRDMGRCCHLRAASASVLEGELEGRSRELSQARHVIAPDDMCLTGVNLWRNITE